MTFCAQKTPLPLWERFHRDWLLSLMRIAVEPLPQSSCSVSGLSGLGKRRFNRHPGEGRGPRPTQVIDHAEGMDTEHQRYGGKFAFFRVSLDELPLRDWRKAAAMLVARTVRCQRRHVN